MAAVKIALADTASSRLFSSISIDGHTRPFTYARLEEARDETKCRPALRLIVDDIIYSAQRGDTISIVA